MPEDVLFTTSEVAERFKVDNSAVRRWVAKKQLIPTVKTPGGYYRFSESVLAEFDARLRAEIAAEASA